MAKIMAVHIRACILLVVLALLFYVRFLFW